MMIRFAVLLLALLAGSGQLFAAEQRSPAAALADRLDGYQTFEADFTQQVTDGQGRLVQDSSGHMRAKDNGLFHWEVEPPMSQFIAADGEQVEVYDPDLEQVTIYPMDDKLSATPALLLTGDVRGLDEAYQVTRLNSGDGTSGFRLEPRDPDSLFIYLTLVFEGDALQEMRLMDSLEQTSVLTFSNIRINQPINDEQFTLEYPESADVIRNQAQP